MRPFGLRFACVVLLAGLPSGLAAQSLADVAKKTEEERAKAAAEKKDPATVITNDDLKKKPTVPDPAAAAAEKANPSKPATRRPGTTTTRPLPAKPAATRPAPERYDPRQNEAYWKQRATYLRQRLDANERYAAAGRAEIARMQHAADSVGCWSCPAGNQLQSQLIQMQESQKRREAMVKADKDAIQAFEEEGRVAGVLPGWLRPY